MTDDPPASGSTSSEEAAADRAAAAGDVAAARRLLLAVVAREPGRIDAWLKLSAMCRADADLPAALDAMSGALRVDPLHFIALLGRARLLDTLGLEDEAARAYAAALAQRPEGEAATPALRIALAQAEARDAAYKDRLAAAWAGAIAAETTITGEERARLARYSSNALRRTRVYHSEPTDYHYPGLAEREFHDRSSFPWLAELEAAADAIRSEYLALVEADSGLGEPYVQYSDDVPLRQWRALNRSRDWTAYHLLRGGERVAAVADRCPQTMVALAAIPQPEVPGRSPNAMFSLLRPRTTIPPHTGVANTRLVCHLALVIPSDCRFRVGAETRAWRPGEAFVFDDTIEHEASNDSDLPRVVLIIDVWHPGLSAGERRAIAAMMAADGVRKAGAL